MSVYLQVLFWATVSLITYVYFGYPALLWILCRFKGNQPNLPKDNFEPTMSLIIAAYNEEQVIARKLENCLALDYPKDKLEIVVVSDGSTDRTAAIVHEFTALGIQLVDLPRNVGKASAQNAAVKQSRGEILLFTDADASLPPESLRQIVMYFRNDRIGCVVGQVKYSDREETGVSEGEGFYWRYELFLREGESRLGILAMGSGALIVVRRSLFEPMDPAVSEDFVLPMRAAIRGYETIYAPEILALTSLSQDSSARMLKTKSRTVALDARGLFLCRAILNPFRHPLYAWGLVSHKLLRWLVPYFLIALFAINLLLLNQSFYVLTLVLQIVFYVLALTGYLWQKKGNPPRILGVPFSFCLVNLAALVGVARFVTGKKSGRWEPVRA